MSIRSWLVELALAAGAETPEEFEDPLADVGDMVWKWATAEETQEIEQRWRSRRPLIASYEPPDDVCFVVLVHRDPWWRSAGLWIELTTDALPRFVVFVEETKQRTVLGSMSLVEAIARLDADWPFSSDRDPTTPEDSTRSEP